MRYDEAWVAAWRTTEKASCRAGDECRSPPPHLVMACTLDDAGLCRECSVRRGGTGDGGGPLQAVEQLRFGL